MYLLEVIRYRLWNKMLLSIDAIKATSEDLTYILILSTKLVTYKRLYEKIIIADLVTEINKYIELSLKCFNG